MAEEKWAVYLPACEKYYCERNIGSFSKSEKSATTFPSEKDADLYIKSRGWKGAKPKKLEQP